MRLSAPTETTWNFVTDETLSVPLLLVGLFTGMMYLLHIKVGLKEEGGK
jgi:hypothetical protein